MSTHENPSASQVSAFLASNGWSPAEVADLLLVHSEYVTEDGHTTVDRDFWTFTAMGHEYDPNVADKRIWSATKVWFNQLDPSVQWRDLSEAERVGAREAFLDEFTS
jgi:hypothetical protein